MRWINLVLLCTLLGSSGCESPYDSTADGGASASAESSALPQAWLPYPEDIRTQFEDDYAKYGKLANQGELEGQINFAFLSGAIAEQLETSGRREDAYAYYRQAARVLRSGLAEKPPGLPQSLVGEIFFHEARALAADDKHTEAFEALQLAFEQGYGDFDALESAEDLASLRDSEGYATRLQQWKSLHTARLKAEVQREMEASESFEFELAATDIEGNPVDLSELKGNVVIVDVWGTWCPPCRAEIPSFVKLQETYGDQGFQMIGLNYEREGSEEANLAAVKAFVAETGINYPCILGDEATRSQIPNFSGFPTTLFIDKSGTVRLKAVGLHEYAFLETAVEMLLAD